MNKINFKSYAKLSEDIFPAYVSLCVYDKNKITLEGSYEIIKYSDFNITLKFKNFIVAIFGENFFVSSMQEKFIAIEGNINKIEYIDLQRG